MAAASVGEAQPNRIDPSTAKIINSGGTKLRVLIQSFSPNPGSPGSGGMRGPFTGYRVHKTKM